MMLSHRQASERLSRALREVFSLTRREAIASSARWRGPCASALERSSIAAGLLWSKAAWDGSLHAATAGLKELASTADAGLQAGLRKGLEVGHAGPPGGAAATSKRLPWSSQDCRKPGARKLSGHEAGPTPSLWRIQESQEGQEGEGATGRYLFADKGESSTLVGQACELLVRPLQEESVLCGLTASGS